jgi:hypothetical protein
MAMHGRSMAGLAALRSATGKLRIRFASIPMGGRVEFRSIHADAVAAVHAWFKAQAQAHGSDAVLRK